MERKDGSSLEQDDISALERDKFGLVFDIRRFSTHDGTGIRTNIFFKDCPLRCVWCQNPEGLEGKARPVYFEGKCIRCGTCLSKSERGGVYLTPEKKIRLRRERDDNWDAIIDNCPTGAISMDARYYTVEQLVAEAERDRAFYRNNGGVTVSGGEPLMQGKFVAGLLAALQSRGIHTAIETSLMAPTAVLEECAEHLNLIYADMKLFDAEEHRRFTKVDNRQIRGNIQWLLTSKHRDKVIIRTPVIPTMTATEHNLAAIAEFLSGCYTDVRYELLNYNPLAEAKYHLVEMEYCFKENPKMYRREEMLRFGEIVRAHGIRNLIVEM